ncbi:hypothetical protein B0H63DRAFT_277437 [Podospora didyma]|uniref:Uncharacterized protein n=1 Tax=Podospora didyma TaxID=330526 RepID=A0AAE0N954_9PEZI|nr:hypothetical protein B0H63DRAFT_277437 [Podospora didyma]
MKSAIRPTRGRPGKVTKLGSTSGRGRPARHPQAQGQIGVGVGLGGVGGVGGVHQALQQQQQQQQHNQLQEQPQHQHLLDPTKSDLASSQHQQQHQQQHHHHQHQDPSIVFDDPRMPSDEYAAAAAVAVMDADMTQDPTQGEPEADGDLDDDQDHDHNHEHEHHHHQDHTVDLSNPASILANGGGGLGSSGPSAGQTLQQDLQQAALAGHHAHQHQQPPAQMQGGHQSMDPSLVKTTEMLAQESGYRGLNVESALAKRLAREPGHRHAQQRRPDQALNLARRSNVEALFAHIAGEPARIPCKNCHKGHGPWTSCVVVDGQMCGSCANCWFNASGARCSFHETRNPQLPQQQHAAILPTGNVVLPTADPTYHFPSTHGVVSSHGSAMGGSVGHAALLSSNPMLQQMVSRALGEVRVADKASRQLILIDITAKQLALQIVEYEETMQSQEHAGGPGSSRQGGMGDDSGA